MDMNNDQLAKTLVSLIDETLEEIEELKKSKFSASEIKIEGPGEGVAGKPTNGELDAKKADKEDEKDEDEDDEKDVKKKEKDDEDEDEDKDDAKIEKGVLDEAEKEDVKKKEKKDQEEKEGKDHEEKEDKEEFKKSNDQVTEELMKSYIDTKISPLENKLSTIIDMVNKMADQPLERKSIPAGSIVPLKKNSEETETLSKSDITGKLFDLKKNGTNVDSLDMVKAELGTSAEAATIADKYGLK